MRQRANGCLKGPKEAATPSETTDPLIGEESFLLKTPDTTTTHALSSAPTSSTGKKRNSKPKAKKATETEDWEDEEEKPAKKARKTSATKKTQNEESTGGKQSDKAEDDAGTPAKSDTKKPRGHKPKESSTALKSMIGAAIAKAIGTGTAEKDKEESA